MSFFPSLMGDFDDDPFMGHMRQMNRMMSSFFGGGSPFGGGMLGMGGGGAAPGGEMIPFGGGPMMRGGGAPLMPFGFPDMSQMFQNGGGNCHSFSSSTITTMSNGPDGRPQVYQASQSVRSGPGGVKETKKSVADSRTGVKKLAIGHHIGERAHIVEREHNMRSGEQVENQEYINLEEEEAPEFDQEWRQKTARYSGGGNAIGYHQQSGGGRRSGGGGYHTPAIMPAAPSSAAARGRHAEREAEEEEEEEEEDDEECGVKIVEVDDDEYEEGEREKGDAANMGESAEPVVYVTEEDTVGGKGGRSEEGAKGGQRSRGKKRSHEPEVSQGGGSKSQKIQNRP